MPKPAEELLRIRARQQAAAADLGRRALAGTPLDDLLGEAARVAADELATALVSVSELEPDGQTMRMRAGHGWSPGVLGGDPIPSDPRSPAGLALRTHEPVISEDVASDERFTPSPLMTDNGVVSAMGVAIPGPERPFGVMSAFSRERHSFSADDASFLQTVANVVGAAIGRAHAESVLRRSEERFRVLADTAPAMMWTTDERGEVTFVNETWLRFTGNTLEDEMGDTWSLGVHPDDAEEVISEWLTALSALAPYEQEYRLRRHDGAYRWIVDRGEPRYEEGRYVGYVGTAVDIHSRREMEEALRRVYEREHGIAETLQRSLLPEKLPGIEGVELAARYLPAGSGSDVGGDWYDALELPDGRVALVVGDVVGHGLRAAAAMGQLRNAFRAYALVEPSPSAVMARVNRLVLESGEEAMATVVLLLLDRETGELTFTSAGHPPPLVVAQDNVRFLEGGRSVPVGAADTATFREDRARLEPGAMVLLYTDGLVERRDVPLEDRLAQLAAAARVVGGELPDVCDQLLAGVLGGQDPLDDVALLAVRPDPAGAERIALTLPASPESLAGLRRRLGRFLHAAGATDMEAYEISLTVSEAAANAIEHAYGPEDAEFELEATYEQGVVTATVRDFGAWREQRGETRGRGMKIIEGLMDEVDVAAHARGTEVRMARRLGARVPE